MTFVLGIDIGGTFTDCVAVDRHGEVRIGKAFSTEPDFEDGFMASIEATAQRLGSDGATLLERADAIYHGCTVGTNALVQRRTARTGLLTTRGHRDSVFAMKAGRRLQSLPPELVSPVAHHSKPEPIVPKSLVREIDERVTAEGEVLVELNEAQVREVVGELLEEGVEAFAISLLWSVANDRHERRVAEIVRELAPDAFVSVASRVILRAGEYERTVATIVNALIGPEMDAYLAVLEQRCSEAGYRGSVEIMTCSGGLISTAEARVLPLLTIGSGPVAGLLGSLRVATDPAGGERADGPGDAREINIITGDVGGTTFDVGMVRHGVPLGRRTSWHDQYEYFVPTLDVHSVGAGGGSIIRFDAATSALRVGPQSAGSRPGPVCIGRGGTEPTVTDANLIAGVFDPDYFLGGQVSLDVEGAREALARVGAAIGLGPEETAAAALRIVDNQMADAIRLASVERGIDPRDFVLHAYGGGGAVHGGAVARHVGISQVVVPLSDLAAAWSAFGVAGAEPLVVEEAAQRMNHPFPPDRLNTLWEQLEAAALSRIAYHGVGEDRIALSRHADMRYSLQVNELEIDAPGGVYDSAVAAGLVDRFEAEYARVYGPDTGYAKAGITIMGLRVRCRARVREVAASAGPGEPGRTVELQPHAARDVIFYDAGLAPAEIPIYRIDDAAAATGTAAGPAIIELPNTTVVVPHRSTARVSPRGSIDIALERNP